MDDAGLGRFTCSPDQPRPLLGPRRIQIGPAEGAENRVIDRPRPAPPRPAGRHFWQGGRRKAGRRGAGSAGCRPDLAAEGSTPGPRQHGWPAPFLRVLLRNETSAPARDDSVPSQSVSAARAPAAVSWRALPSLPPPRAPVTPPPPHRSRRWLGADALVCFCRNPRRGRSRGDAGEAEGENRGRSPFAGDGPCQ